MSAHHCFHDGADHADPGRAPLPPGDPLAWGVLIAGTSLEGLPWPGWGQTGGDAPPRQGPRLGRLEP